MGRKPVFAVGGAMSNRTVDGQRRNAKTGVRLQRPASGRMTKTQTLEGTRPRDGVYTMPTLANPGNVIECGAVGGGNMGDDICHETEAPFPESLAEFFIRSFCRPGGTVLDCFAGSGTTVAVACRTGRKGIGIDIRKNQIVLGKRRLAEYQPELL